MSQKPKYKVVMWLSLPLQIQWDWAELPKFGVLKIQTESGSLWSNVNELQVTWLKTIWIYSIRLVHAQILW